MFDFIKKFKIQITLGVIIIIGVVLRFWNIKTQGFFYPDEGQYLLSASTLARVPAALWKVAFLPFGEWSAALKNFFPAGFFEFKNARPGFTVIDILGMWIFGVKEYAPRMINAIFGVLTIIIVYLFGRDIFKNKNVGILAAAFVAFSKYHVFFSRTGESHLISAFFFILAAYFWLKSLEGANRRRYLILAGFSFGFLATTHYMNYFVLAFAVVFEFAAIFCKKEKHTIKDFIVFVASAVALPVFWIFILWLKAKIINSLGFFNVGNISLTYLEEIKQVIAENAGTGSIFSLKTYPMLFWKSDGPLFAILFAFAPFLLLFKKYRQNLAYFYLAAMAYYPIILLSISSVPVPYAILTFYPGIAILVALIIFNFYGLLRSNTAKSIAVFVLALSISSMIVSSSNLTGMYMPHGEVTNFLNERGAKSSEIIAFSWAPYQFLFQASVAGASAKNFISGKYKYYISDPEDNLWVMEPEAKYGGFIRRNLKPIAEFKINYGGVFPDFINWTIISPKSTKELKDLENTKINSTVRVYDISGLDFSKINNFK